MTHWHDTMVDRPETDGAVYVTGWTLQFGFRDLGPPKRSPCDRANQKRQGVTFRKRGSVTAALTFAGTLRIAGVPRRVVRGHRRKLLQQYLP
jgi:hypothetical protein